MHGGRFRKWSKDEIRTEFDTIIRSLSSDADSLSSWAPDDDEEEFIASKFTGLDDDDDPVFTDAVHDVNDSIDQMLNNLQDFSLKEGIDIEEKIQCTESVMLQSSNKQLGSQNDPNMDQVLFSITNFDFDLDSLLEDMDTEKNIDLLSRGSVRRRAYSESTAGNVKGILKNSEETKIVKNDDDNDDGDVVLSFSVSSPYIMTTSDVKGRLQALHSELWSKEQHQDEEAKITAKKIKHALEKLEETTFEKLFVKIYYNDQRTHKVMMIDKAWTARDVKNNMMLKGVEPVEPGPDWCVSEKLPHLSMERILEDSENVLQTVLDWSKQTENVLVFANRKDKYKLFNNPHDFLLTSRFTMGEKIQQQDKEYLLKEYFSDFKDAQVPKTEGILWLRMGEKRWVKFYFALRASGMYYNPKGKKTSRKMVCLALYEKNNLYSGVDFQKKFKAPTNHVFCLKQPEVQDLSSKDIHVLCADDADTKERWLTDIRLAKYGMKMYEDYLKTREEHAKIMRGWSTTSYGRI